MKKILATALFALLGAGAFAQTTQGTNVVSGSIGFSNRGNDYNPGGEYTNTNFHVSPSIGFFYRDNLELGLNTGFSFSFYSSHSEYNTYDTDSKNYSIGFGPYLKKYIPITEKLYLTAKASVGIRFGKTKAKNSEEGDFKESSTNFDYSLGAAPGLTYFATEKLGLSVSIGNIYLDRSTTDNKDIESKYTETSFGATIAPYSSTIGVSYFFSK